MAQEIPDHELLKRIANGDNVAFETLIQRYEQQVAHIMWRFTHQRELHSELVHEVFVQMYLSLENFRGSAPFVHWLSALASRTGYNWWRQKQKQRKFSLLSDDFPEKTPDNNQDENDKIDLFALLEKLKPKDRVVLTLLYYEDKSTQEIADTLGWSPTATRMRISRARRKLQVIAKREGAAPSAP